MLGIYILAAIVGGGLLVFSLLSGAHHDAGGDLAGADVDASGLDAHVGDVDAHLAGADVAAHVGGADHDVHVGQVAAGELILGLLRPRNIIFFLTAFGFTGTLLTLTNNAPQPTLILSLGMGGGALLATHALFNWLRRSESAVEALGERELEGRAARAVLPLSPGRPGRVACLIADQELYLTARLSADVDQPIGIGGEVIILRIENGVAEVIPFDIPELPSPESRG
ncbi:MAG: hypothetical protein JSU87_04625 [Gemmatimonadota bacterium]|nr:MAG: hypothetical protein JSU87_04625 [Gemmatimonadota bacterium]